MTSIMISQPMAGKTEEEIQTTKDRFLEYAKEHNYKVVNTWFKDTWNAKHQPIYLLSMSISAMSACDAVYFSKGWELARGCKIEHSIAKDYGLTIIYE